MLHFNELEIRDYSFEQKLRLHPIQWQGQWINNWFSNFHTLGSVITYKGYVTRCLELAYVAAKNPDILVDYITKEGMVYTQIRFIDLIFRLNNPGTAKRLSKPKYMKGLIDTRPDWEYVKLSAMDNFLRQRWRPNTPETNKLVNMIAHDRIEGISDDPIMEINNWGDRVWGVTINDWCGRNALGRLLHVIVLEFMSTGNISYGASEEHWIIRQAELIRFLNDTYDGGKTCVFDREY